MAVTNQQVLDAVEGVARRFDALNGRLRESEQTQAAIVQWRRDHEQAHDDHEQAHDAVVDEVRDLRRRQNIGASALGVTQLISSTITASLFGKSP